MFPEDPLDAPRLGCDSCDTLSGDVYSLDFEEDLATCWDDLPELDINEDMITLVSILPPPGSFDPVDSSRIPANMLDDIAHGLDDVDLHLVMEENETSCCWS